MRRLSTPDEFFDIMDQLGNGKFVTIGYVTGANLKVPKVKRLNPLTNRQKTYDDYSVFDGGDKEIGAIIKLTSKNFQYLNRDTVNKKYGEYKNSANDIRAKYGIDPIGDKKGSYTQKINYGKNGLTGYSGEKEELKKHTYFPQNTVKARSQSTYYIVDKEGSIIKTLSKEELLPYFETQEERNSKISGVKALREINADDETIKRYIEELASLNFSYQSFESDSILWLAATVNGEPIIYINNSFKRSVNDININPQDFIAIANERYEKEIEKIEAMDESMTNVSPLLNESAITSPMLEELNNTINLINRLDNIR